MSPSGCFPLVVDEPFWVLPTQLCWQDGGLEAWIGFIFGTEVMLACNYAGETSPLKAGIGFFFGTEVILAFGYAGEIGVLKAWRQ